MHCPVSPFASAFPLRRVAAAALLALGLHAAQAQTADFSLTAQPLAQALPTLARQAGLQLMASPELLRGVQGRAVSGRKDARVALGELLQGTGLRGRIDGGLLIIERAPVVATAVNTAAAAETDAVLPTVVVQGDKQRRATTEGTGAYTARATSSATKMELSLRETPQSITVMTQQMIQDKGLTSVEQVLAYTPGVSLVGDASQNSQIFVRGFYLDSGIQIDGLNTTSAQPVYEGSLSQGLDPAIADRVEVIKGASGIVGGLGEPSATVNFVRKLPTDQFQASVDLNLGSWSRQSLQADVSGPLTANGQVRGRLVAAVRKGDSFMDRYSFERKIVYGVVDAKLDASTTVALAVDHQQADTDGAYNWNSNPAFYTDGGVFKPSRNFSTGQDWTYWNTTQTSLTPWIEHRFDNGWLAKAVYRHAEGKIDRVSFYPGDYVDRDTGDMVGAWSDAYADRSLRHSDTDSVDAYATGPFEAFGRRHELVAGVSYGRNSFSMATYRSDTLAAYNVADGAIAEPALSSTARDDNDYRQTQGGLFATVRLNPMDDLKLMLGGRLSNWQHTTDDRLNDEQSTVKHNSIKTPYVGAVYDLNANTSVYASYVGVFRPVTYHGADGALLDPAEGSNMEAGVKMAFFNDHLNFSAAVYRTKEDNYPQFANQGQLPNGEWIYESIDGVKTTGFEAELSGRLAPGWELSMGYTHNQAEDADGNAKLTYVPKNLFKVSLNHSLNDMLTLGGAVRWQSRSYYETGIYGGATTIAVTQQQKAYTLVDLMARWHFNDTFSATLNLNNVFDTSYNRSMWGYADYGEPRNVMVGLRAQW